MEATTAFQKQRQAVLRIFLSEHKGFDGKPTEEEAIMMQFQGDDSSIPVPAVFMFVPGMPIVVNKNTHQGLKLVNGASYTAVDVVLDKSSPGYRISADTILHFGPPAAIGAFYFHRRTSSHIEDGRAEGPHLNARTELRKFAVETEVCKAVVLQN